MTDLTSSDLMPATREMLVRERATVIARMESLARDALDLELESDGVPPSGYEREQALGDMLNVRLQQIDDALQRVDLGQYGVCTGCAQPIPPRRLEVLPFATLCVSCQSAEDKRAKRRAVQARA
jgi:DnaK suppressor protein